MEALQDKAGLDWVEDPSNRRPGLSPGSACAACCRHLAEEGLTAGCGSARRRADAPGPRPRGDSRPTWPPPSGRGGDNPDPGGFMELDPARGPFWSADRRSCCAPWAALPHRRSADRGLHPAPGAPARACSRPWHARHRPWAAPTLPAAGCVEAGRRPALIAARMPGRRAPAVLERPAGQVLIWDGRFEVDNPAGPSGGRRSRRRARCRRVLDRVSPGRPQLQGAGGGAFPGWRPRRRIARLAARGGLPAIFDRASACRSMVAYLWAILTLRSTGERAVKKQLKLCPSAGTLTMG